MSATIHLVSGHFLYILACHHASIAVIDGVNSPADLAAMLLWVAILPGCMASALPHDLIIARLPMTVLLLDMVAAALAGVTGLAESLTVTTWDKMICPVGVNVTIGGCLFIMSPCVGWVAEMASRTERPVVLSCLAAMQLLLVFWMASDNPKNQNFTISPISQGSYVGIYIYANYDTRATLCEIVKLYILGGGISLFLILK